MTSTKVVEVTPEMTAAGVESLRMSDYGASLRFQTDEEIVQKIFVSMASKVCTPSKDEPKSFDESQTDRPIS